MVTRQLAPVDGIEPPLAVLETAALPLYYTGIKLAPRPGIEPGTDGLTVRRSTAELSGNTSYICPYTDLFKKMVNTCTYHDIKYLRRIKCVNHC